MKIFITGSTGYVGERVVYEAQRRRHKIVEASRNRPNGAENWIYYDLDQQDPIDYPGEIDVVIHLAVNTDNPSEDDRELNACKRLQSFAALKAARFIFVSSQAARQDAPSAYGRIKWAIEQEVLKRRGYVVRLGQVYGGHEKGLFGVLVNAARKLPVLPAFIPAPKIQPIHVDDCAAGLLNIAEKDNLDSSIVSLASSTSVSFTDFMKAIVSQRLNSKRLFIPVPMFVVRILSILVGKSLSARWGLSRLMSLFDLDMMETEKDLNIAGLSLLEFSKNMQPKEMRIAQIKREGQALLSYVLREAPPASLVERYVATVTKLRGDFTLGIPSWALQYPSTLSLFSDTDKYPEFQWRLNAATRIAEASIVGGNRFIGSREPTSRLSAIIGLISSVFGSVFWTVLSVIFAPLIRTREAMRHFR